MASGSTLSTRVGRDDSVDVGAVIAAGRNAGAEIVLGEVLRETGVDGVAEVGVAGGDPGVDDGDARPLTPCDTLHLRDVLVLLVPLERVERFVGDAPSVVLFDPAATGDTSCPARSP